MEYVYAAMLLHKAGKTIDEASVKKVLEAAHIKADDGRVKSLVAALDGVNIDEAIKNASFAAPAAVAHTESKPAEKKKEDKKEEKVSEEQAAAGLGALFG
ncbi:50S ribosomal protein P1 [Candidatus Woesearchaeota archaeon]|nr:MAG: 50S ribosomal protein P1 [Candidatus Woesearchaeota archaeon]